MFSLNFVFKFNLLKIDFFSGFSEIPYNSEPILLSQIDNHDPLNPVCPVIKIFFFL